MSDIVLYLSIASALLVILCVVSLLFRRRAESDKGGEEIIAEEIERDAPARQVEPRRVAGARQVRSRFQAQRARREQRRDELDEEQDQSDFDEDERDVEDDIVLPEGKIGVKKRRKLELKAEKRAQREAELQDREDKKRRHAQQDEERRLQQEREKQEELTKEEEARKIREEKAKREHEEYLQLKAAFTVESEGYDEKENEEEKDLLAKFVDHIKNEKVVVLEDLAVRFNMKTQDAINRVESLVDEGRLIGVIDDRGKFIYITAEELKSIAKFIRQRGRVSISDLAESSNSLISLASKETVESNA